MSTRTTRGSSTFLTTGGSTRGFVYISDERSVYTSDEKRFAYISDEQGDETWKFKYEIGCVTWEDSTTEQRLRSGANPRRNLPQTKTAPLAGRRSWTSRSTSKDRTLCAYKTIFKDFFLS